jgi:hypothetical protein
VDIFAKTIWADVHNGPMPHKQLTADEQNTWLKL